MAPVLKEVYTQMAEPKWVLSVGACASSGGIFDTYSVLQGIDRVIPVDVYVPGCPPRPEQIIDGILKIQELVGNESLRRRYSKEYEQLLSTRRRMDTADLLRLARAALEDAGSTLPPSLEADLVVLVPGLGMRGLAGALTAALVTRGAKLLESEPVHGLDTPPRFLWKSSKDAAPGSWLRATSPPPEDVEVLRVEFFRAASVHDELREVLRRAATNGTPWDRVEIVTPDPGVAPPGVAVLVDAGTGHPDAVAAALADERARDGVVVVMADCPLVRAESLDVLAGAAQPFALAPARDGGVNAIALRDPTVFAPRFGVSAEEMAAAARAAGIEPVVVDDPGLAFDVDRPEDLAFA